MSSEFLARNCAPTLAGLKAGSICPVRGTKQELQDAVDQLDRSLEKKGVHARLLYRQGKGPSLVYLYRKKGLQKILQDPNIQRFLGKYGYSDFSLPTCLDLLEQRLAQEEFPHDIGVFLDYPLPDIEAFILNKGRNCPCTGCWKAYTNIPQAQKKFRQFRRCTDYYCRCVSNGADISRLTVAG